MGIEADVPVGSGGDTFGLAYDRSENPRTVDKPAQPDADALAFSAAFRTDLARGLALAMAVGWRTRFPSSRELFGEALGRFLPSPQLRPGTAWLADVELSWRRPGFTLSLNPFYSRRRNDQPARGDGRGSAATPALQSFRVHAIRRRRRA